jgi:Amt family ammonium transporter
VGFRIEEDHELTGVDLVVHAENAYDLHVSTGGARPHFGHD